jgi:hypothetical protein
VEKYVHNYALMLITCFSLQDINNAKCQTLCIRDGYSDGVFKASSCLCIESKGSIDDFIHRRVLNLPSSNATLTVTAPKKIETKHDYRYLDDNEY